MDQEVMAKDNLFFKNIEAIESILTVASFDKQGIAGTWKVTQDDLYSSHSKYKDFFMLVNEQVSEQTESYVNFEVKNYDYVGPPSFHQDDEFDPFRDAYTHPWLSIRITMMEPGHKRHKNQMQFSMVYKLDERHLSINKSKRSFRPNKPDKMFVTVGNDK